MQKNTRYDKKFIKLLFLSFLTMAIVSYSTIFFSTYFLLNKIKQKEINETKNTLYCIKKNELKYSVINLSKAINNIVNLTIKKTKKEVINRANFYYKIIETLKEYNKNKKFIINFLNKLNDKLNNNYIFVYDLNGNTLVHKYKNYKKYNVRNIKTVINNISFYKESLNILNNKKKEGFITIKFPDPLTHKKLIKIDYIKYFPDLKIFIGTGVFTKSIKKKILADLYERIMFRRHGKNFYYYIFNLNGKLFANPYYKKYIGKNILYLKDANGKYFIKEMIKKALKNKNGAFVKYEWINPVSKKLEEKISYVIYNKKINSIIGSGIYLNTDIKNNIKKIINNINNKFNKYINIFNIIFILFFFITISIIIVIYNKLKNLFWKYDKIIKKEKNKAEFEALHDTLTKVGNRKFFNIKLKKYFQNYIKDKNNKFVIAMIDIDYFKKINDTYGHDMGDKVLKKLASFFRRNIKKTDFFARWGGEEFMLILSNADLETGYKICKKLKEKLQNDINIQNPVKFTISCGITEIREEDNITSLLRRVDQALYKAKNTGRNKIVKE